MIKANEGYVELEGSVGTLLVEVVSIVRSIHKAMVNNDIPEDDAKEMVEYAIALAFKDEKELRKEAYKEITKLSDMLFEALFGEESETK